MLSRQSLIRRFIATLAVMAFFAPFLASSAVNCVETMFNTPHLWIPATNPERRLFEWCVERFESEALVVISWPGCTVDDPRLEEFETAIIEPADATTARRHAELFDHVVTGYTVARQLMEKPISLNRRAANELLSGALIGPDGETSCAVVVFTDTGGYFRREAIERIVATAEAVCQVDRSELHLAGPPVDGVAIDNAGIETMKRYVVPSALLSFLICWYCLRSFRYAAAVMLVAAFGEGLSLALFSLAGHKMNAILILMPPLVFVLTVASGVHLVNYYLDEARAGGDNDEAVRRALRVGWLPCVLAAITTGIGLASLVVSDVAPIRSFGIYSTAGVVVTLLLLLMLLPGAWVMWPWSGENANPSDSPRRPFTDKLADLVIVHGKWIGAASLVLIGFLGCGLGSIETSVKLRALFAPGSPVLSDYQWLEQKLGPMVPVEVIVQFPAVAKERFVERVELIRDVARTTGELPDVDGVMSAATFAPPKPRGGGVRQVIQRKRHARQLFDQRWRFVEARYLSEADGGQAWRVAARVPALSDVDYQAFLERLHDHVAPVIETYRSSAEGDVEMKVTGAIPLIYQTQRILLNDLFNSFLTALLVVGIVMILVLRSVRAGLLAMIPNIFPTAVILGLMGWLRAPIDIGSVMTASIALGIAVVDTMHLLAWFRREVSAGESSGNAVRHALRHCAPAMIQTSVICGVGMLVFVFSSFMPASRFSWMVFVLLMTALIGDLLILPALLAGPLGRLLVPRQSIVAGRAVIGTAGELVE